MPKAPFADMDPELADIVSGLNEKQLRAFSKKLARWVSEALVSADRMQKRQAAVPVRISLRSLGRVGKMSRN
jgi:hypothetical protein